MESGYQGKRDSQLPVGLMSHGNPRRRTQGGR
uniref:Uncharacterized protein n=1 Tax=Anguilla anguilla TaxID=7936 RepID=A0A0E9QIM7_ANGAN